MCQLLQLTSVNDADIGLRRYHRCRQTDAIYVGLAGLRRMNLSLSSGLCLLTGREQTPSGSDLLLLIYSYVYRRSRWSRFTHVHCGGHFLLILLDLTLSGG